MFFDFLDPILLAILLIIVINTKDVIKAVKTYGRRSDFKCSMCGNCCRFLTTPVTDADIARIREGGYDDFVRDDMKALKRVNGRCMFLKDDRCSIHEIRPQVCRDYPFFKLYGVGYCRKATFCPALERLRNE